VGQSTKRRSEGPKHGGNEKKKKKRMAIFWGKKARVLEQGETNAKSGWELESKAKGQKYTRLDNRRFWKRESSPKNQHSCGGHWFLWALSTQKEKTRTTRAAKTNKNGGGAPQGALLTKKPKERTPLFRKRNPKFQALTQTRVVHRTEKGDLFDQIMGRSGGPRNRSVVKALGTFRKIRLGKEWGMEKKPVRKSKNKC